MRDTVEAILANTVLLVGVIGKAVNVGIIRHGLVKSRIKNGYLRNIRQNISANIDADNIWRIVQRSKLAAGFDILHNLISNQTAVGKKLAAVNKQKAIELYSLRFSVVL